MMPNLRHADLRRTFASALGALLLSGLCVIGAVGPARAVETSPAAIGA